MTDRAIRVPCPVCGSPAFRWVAMMPGVRQCWRCGATFNPATGALTTAVSDDDLEAEYRRALTLDEPDVDIDEAGIGADPA